MKKLLITLSILAAFALFASNTVLAANQFEGAIPQSENPCGNTQGNGQIISLGNNSFTLKRNDGRNLIVNLTGHATIKTSTGFISLSDLKIGDRVTLVGGDNRDGSFTADTVALCSGTEEAEFQENGIAQANRILVRNNDTNYKKVSGAIDFTILFFVGLVWLGIIAFLKLKKKISWVFLLFFTIFYIYLYKVLDYTLLQFQSLLLLKHFLPNLMLKGVETGRAANLIPIATLTLEDIKTSLLNILMMMPFGFGLPFITVFRMKKVVIAGLLLSIVIEFLQLITGFTANTTFRIADVNDLIFNTLGVGIGYVLFVIFVRIYRYVTRNSRMRTNPISRFISERPQVEK